MYLLRPLPRYKLVALDFREASQRTDIIIDDEVVLTPTGRGA
jgi:hypothetical protein